MAIVSMPQYVSGLFSDISRSSALAPPNDMGGEPPWTGMANEDVSFIYLWMLEDQGLRDEAEILHEIARGA